MNEGSKLEEIVDKVMHLVHGNKVLDVGTGFGTLITKLFNSNIKEVTSIDPEAWTFDSIEREYCTEITSGRLRLMRTGAERMPFENNAFDTSMAICSLHHLPDTMEGVMEMERVTSARVIITDWDPTSSGIHNPHSPEELQNVKDRIMEHSMNHGYNFEENGMWYLAWR